MFGPQVKRNLLHVHDRNEDAVSFEITPTSQAATKSTGNPCLMEDWNGTVQYTQEGILIQTMGIQ